MSKTNHPERCVLLLWVIISRYGSNICTRHGISHRELERIVLDDLNKIIQVVGDLKTLVEQSVPQKKLRNLQAERERVQSSLDRVHRLKKCAYEDYRSELLTKEEYLSYREDYARQETALSSQLGPIGTGGPGEDVLERPWITALLKHGENSPN